MSELESTYPSAREPSPSASTGLIDNLMRKVVVSRLRQLTADSLVLSDGQIRHAFGVTDRIDCHSNDCIRVSVEVLHPRFYSYVALGGAIGAAEAYMQGYWSCDKLTQLVRLLLRNRGVLENLDTGAARFVAPLRRLLHRINKNTRAGTRRNIAAHYDLGNDFFRLWLDETMMYSSAIFARPEMSLHDASIAKLDRICRKLELSAEDHVLEIGTGWGGFALYAAREYGCKVTTTTISREQYEYARSQVEAAGLSDQITLLLRDYRDLDGRYDKLVSIEMIEAVGHEFLDEYFTRCSSLLKADGMMLLQAITIADQRYAGALKSVDFIQRYIFPGGFLPSVTAMLQSITKTTDMRSYHLEDIGPHYAETLKRWRRRFNVNLSRVRSLGYSEEFLRMWDYYYCYCEGAFTERAIGTAQLLLIKPGCRREPLVPPLTD